MWLSVWNEMQIVVQLMPQHPETLYSLASFKSGLVLLFWYRLTQVFLEKRPLNRCSSSSSSYFLFVTTLNAYEMWKWVLLELG